MVISSRTPEGSPGQCPICGAFITVEPSDPAGDAPCPSCGHLLWFTWQDAGDVVFIKPSGSVLRSEAVDTLIVRASERHGVRFVLDLGDVLYFSSAALGKLINLKKQVVGARGHLKIENLSADLVEVFRITRLDQVFEIGSL
jgi:HptB-dependent secretion and biofilm anti anti-sigma factor